MKKMIAIWALALVLNNALLFLPAKAMTAAFWISFGFILLAYIAVLALWLGALRKNKTADERFLHMPGMAVSLIYIGIQFPIALIFSLGAAAISWRIAALIHVAVLAVCWIIIIGSLVGNEHIEKVNSRQKDHRKEL